MYKNRLVLHLLCLAAISGCSDNDSFEQRDTTPTCNLYKNRQYTDKAPEHLVPKVIDPIEREAFELCEEKAQQNDVYAINDLAIMYAKGQGVEQDIAKAISLFKQAVDDDYAIAMYNLALMDRINIMRDSDDTIALLNKAIAKGHIESMTQKGIVIRMRVGHYDDIKGAMQLWEKAAEGGSEQAVLRLANVYIEGSYDDSFAKDYKKAYELLEPLAKSGNTEAIIEIAHMYKEGLYVKKDYTKAYELYSKAADLGYPAGKCFLAILYREGSGVSQDFKKAFELLNSAASSGQSDAIFTLGLMYYDGEFVDKDLVKSCLYFKLAWLWGEYDMNNYSVVSDELTEAQNAEVDKLFRKEIINLGFEDRRTMDLIGGLQKADREVEGNE
ncbi:MAG: sel1 repeat family protein [Phycisphaerae bacterium]|nr:sel1 repeat family protein [Phycisphaerae bacterium]